MLDIIIGLFHIKYLQWLFTSWHGKRNKMLGFSEIRYGSASIYYTQRRPLLTLGGLKG